MLLSSTRKKHLTEAVYNLNVFKYTMLLNNKDPVSKFASHIKSDFVKKKKKKKVKYLRKLSIIN